MGRELTMSRFNEDIPDPKTVGSCECGCDEDIYVGEDILVINNDKVKGGHFYDYAMKILDPTYTTAGDA